MRLALDKRFMLAFLAGLLTVFYALPMVQRSNRFMQVAVVILAYFATAILVETVLARQEGFATTTCPACSGTGTAVSTASGTAAGTGASGPTASPICPDCGTKWPCPVHINMQATPICPPVPDMSKYVLKTSIPPCPPIPDMDNYMLKSECPPVPDMSQYVLKSSVPKQGPIIIDTSADNKSKCGDCPPCPRPRCPEVICPPAPKCPVPPPCPRMSCPQQVVKCKAEEVKSSPVRPFLAPLGFDMFG
jgi:hypothetical protein